MKVLPVIRRTVRLCLLAALLAGGVALYVWSQSDQLVRKELVKRFDQVAPELMLVVGDVDVRSAKRTVLRDIEILDRKKLRPVFRARELAVDLDSDRLLNDFQVQVNRIHLNAADILLTRDENGQWNWQGYQFTPPAKQQKTLPEIILTDTRIQLTLKHGGNIPTARLLLTSPSIEARPKSATEYDVAGHVALPGAGLMNLHGGWDLETRQWNLAGHLRDVQADRQLMDLARATAPEMEGRLEEIDQRLERILPVAEGSSRPSGAALVIGNDSSIAPQFFGVLDVDFDAHGGPQQAVPDFRLRVEVRDGRIGSAAIPMTLTDVQARFYRDNNNIIFRLDDARGGETRLSGGFEMLTTPDAPPGKAWFDVKDFPVSMKLRPLLPEKTQRLFDAFQPEGFLSARGQVLQRSDGTWMPENVTGSVRGGTAVYHRFRYAASDIQATLQQRPFQTTAAQGTEPALTDRDVLFDVRVAGNIGEHRFDCAGWWRNPGIDNESRFEMQVPDLPIDGPFRNALEAKQLAVIESLNLDGNLHANLVFYRPPGKDRVTQTYVDAVLTNGSMRFARFPYDVTDLSGRVTFDLLKKRWEFHDLAGRHGDGRLMGQGTFVGEPAPGQLHLVVTAQGAALNADLYNALPRSQRHLWNMVQPEGFCDLTTDIHWTAIPGQPPLVRFPEEAPVRIYNTRIRPVPFPLDMFIREAVVSFNPNDVRFAGVQHCTIHSFNALHDESPIRATGWAEVKPEGEWQVHFNDITATNLRPDDNLRAALPQSWRQSLSRLTSSGSVSVENSEIDFRGLTSGQCNTTARWDMNLRFRDCVMNAGLDVSQVYGKVTAQGVWDGAHLDNVGVIQLETAQVLDMPITSVNGPYSLTEKELILGARDVFTQKDLTTISRDRRIKARAYGGEVLLDALVDLSPDGQYRLFTEVTGALLEAYAALHIPEQKNLRGVVKAWMSLVGSGDTPAGIQGEGQLQISPAALYELPVIVKLFGALSQLKFNVQDRTAFDYALLDFKVRNEAFEFERVDLVGESISLRGRGSVGFGGDVLLDFYSRPPRPTAASIPILNRLLTQWTKVEVRGTTSRPQTTARPLGQIDQGVQQFLTAFNPVPGSPVPMLTAPRFFTPPQPLLPRLLPQTGNSRQQRY